MVIQEMVLKFRYPILGALLLCLATFFILYLAPSFLTVLAYFWPLFFSTTLFLAIVLLFAKTAPPPATDASLPKPGEELLHYVAGHPDVPPLELDNHNHNKSD